MRFNVDSTPGNGQRPLERMWNIKQKQELFKEFPSQYSYDQMKKANDDRLKDILIYNDRKLSPRGNLFHFDSIIAINLRHGHEGEILWFDKSDAYGTLLDAGRAVLGALRTALLFILSLIPTPDIPAGADMEPPATGDDSSLREFYRTLPWPATLRRVLFIFWVIIVMGMFLFALWRLCTMVLEWLKRRGNSSGVEI